MPFSSTHPALARALTARNYEVPTAVQRAVLEEAAATRDLLVSAQTGSGKTVAFGMAMAKPLLGEAERFERAAEPLALIIAPTRELAMQVHRELAWLYADTGARVVTCVGGMDARAEGRLLDQGAHIVVGTPGRLRDHLERRRLNLTKLRSIVLDEADEMLDLGFREDLEVILDATPEGRQTLLFSATMPREIEMLARRYQRDALRIETIRRDEAHADIEYRAIAVAPHDIENAVVNVLRLHEVRAALVFCATREAVKRTHARLMERGFSAVALSGELTQHERTQALQALRDGRARVLVATDLALVIHSDLPNDRETLLHRSGRTGRAGRKGLVTLVVPFNRRRKAEMLIGAARVNATWGPPPTAEEIRARDQERFLADAMFTEAPTPEDAGLVQSLQAARSADEIALALIRLHRAQLPAPEDLAEDTGPPKRGTRLRDDRMARERPIGERSGRERPNRERPGRDDRNTEGAAPRDAGERSFERAPRAPRREDTREMVWFRLNIGRERNADPRWLVPLICKAGGISKAEIGSIKIFDRDTRFQIVAEIADDFAFAVRTNKTKEGHIARVGAHTSADDEAVAEALVAIGTDTPPAKSAPRAPYEPRPARPARVAPARQVDDAVSPAPQDAPPKERFKPRWRDTGKTSSDHARKPFGGKGGGFKGSGFKGAGFKGAASKDVGKPDFRARSAPSGTGQVSSGRSGQETGGPAKPPSKYAHKKKHRPGPAGGA